LSDSTLSATRSATGQFLPGRSGNPAGRPLGARNRSTLLAEALLDDDAESIVRAIIDKALAGNMPALRACFKVIAPASKDSPVELDLPKIKSVEDLVAASAALIANVGAGEITPLEGERVMKLLTAHHSIIRIAAAPRHAARAAAPKTAVARPLASATAPSSSTGNCQGGEARGWPRDEFVAASRRAVAAAEEPCISPVFASAVDERPGPSPTHVVPGRSAALSARAREHETGEDESLYFSSFEGRDGRASSIACCASAGHAAPAPAPGSTAVAAGLLFPAGSELRAPNQATQRRARSSISPVFPDQTIAARALATQDARQAGPVQRAA
jgi:hypothetical protein